MACTLTSVAPNPMRNTEAGPAGGRETGGWDEYACQVFEKLLDGIKTSPQVKNTYLRSKDGFKCSEIKVSIGRSRVRQDHVLRDRDETETRFD